MKIRNAILGAGLWVVAAGASALSLGASRGSVVLGSPLDLTFEVQPDAGTDVASSCVTASVKAGDIPLSDAQVRLTPLAAGVRVQVRNVVDEPVVLVTLSAGCAGRTTRTYTFLADPPQALQRGGRAPAGTTPLASVPLVVEAARDRTVPPVVEADTGASSKASSQPRPPYRTPSVRKEARPAPAAGGVDKASSRSARAVAPKDADRSRLVMEPLDTWLEVPLTLRSTLELPQAPASETNPQREQAAALWRNLNRDPQAPVEDVDARRKLESELTQLQARTTRDQAAAVELQRQLDEAEGRFDPWIVYALAAALAAALGGMAWMWRRSGQTAATAARSWRESVAVSKRKAEPKDIVELERLEEVPSHPADRWGRPVSSPAAAKPSSAASSVDILLEPEHVTPEMAGFVETPVVAGGNPEPVLQHIINPEELFDIQQQAEFFVSVGEHDQAVEVLRQHIDAHEETSPVAYLELLRLYRTLSRAADFNVLRQRFMRHFNANVPEFASFDRRGKSLDQYLDALAEIEAQWSSPEVLYVLEKHMFYRSGEGRKTAFDLAAYDDLLLLLAIAQTTPATARGAPPPRKRTTPMPQSFEAAAAHALSALTPLSPMDTTPDFPLDSLAAALEFGFEPPAPPAPPVSAAVEPEASLQEVDAAKGPETMPQAPLLADLVVSAPAPLAGASRAYRPAATVAAPASTFTLDIDLSDPVPITISDLPPVPVTPPPPPGQPIGFGSSNDLMELSLELEPLKPGEKKL
ncbi:hypothetical protein ACDW_24940 [Acidovorax sp. DW039]|uniref:type IV pilus assembly protein FimV n=1 Tax=Acidovorax sp. DW039 TaxID=3095606 RepID=UPI00309349DF|nr:hypothetical protein ACDW_24940 [Acidovorax sp. DW039]